MTRINLLEVGELADQHLMAEYRELPRMAEFALKTVQKQENIPVTFTLNKGHMTFFLDKAEFLEDRHRDITEELLARGYNLTKCDPFKMDRVFKQRKFIPTEEEIAISRERVESKLAMKPEWYRWSNKK